ncbi:MAG: hypothetical protein R6W69_14015 [Anaerolineales bacterium]
MKIAHLLRAWPMLALLAPIQAYLATSTYGPGVTGDGLRYLSTAQNLRDGLGVVDYSLSPLLAWPPLYPLILTLGADIFLFAWAVSLFLYALNVYLAGRLAATLFPDFAPAPALVALVTLASPSILRLHTSLGPDPLFLALVLAFLLLAANWQTSISEKADYKLPVLLFLAAAAAMVKYPGLALALIGGILLLTRYWRTDKVCAIFFSGAFALLSSLPLAAWVILHNFLKYGSFFGERGGGHPFDNLTITLEKLLYWFIPYSIVGSTGPFLLLAGLVLLAALCFKPKIWKKLFAKIIAPAFLPTSLFFVVYFGMMLFLVSYAEHKDYRVDRLHILLFIPALLFLLSLFEQAEIRWQVKRFPIRRALLISLLVLVWLVYPLNNTVKYVRASIANGELAGNLYNTRALNESDIVAYLRANSLPHDATLYSNHEGAVWFFTRRNALNMPQGPRSEKDNFDLPAILDAYQDWPPAPGYIVWFDLAELNFKEHVLPPEELAPLVEIKPIFIGQDGAVYQIAQ